MHTPTRDGSENFYAEAKIGDAHCSAGGYFSDPSMAAAIYLHVADADATYKRAISLGAKSVREPSDRLEATAWGREEYHEQHTNIDVGAPILAETGYLEAVQLSASISALLDTDFCGG